ncbi:MAG: gamma-glutamylcyclotransferase family protein [Deinococcota bacterium]
MVTPPTRVFVYGTLMPGERNAQVAARGGIFQARPARLAGFRLLHLVPEGYPGILPGAADEEVQGYVLTYGASDWERVLPFLDALEGVHETPPLYTRERVTVTLENGERVPAWVYVYAHHVRLTQPGVLAVPGNDWRRVPDRRRPRPGHR